MNTEGTDCLCLNKSAGSVIELTEKLIHLCSLPTGNDTKKHKPDKRRLITVWKWIAPPSETALPQWLLLFIKLKEQQTCLFSLSCITARNGPLMHSCFNSMFLESCMSLSPKHIYWGLWIPSWRPLPSNDVRRAVPTNHLNSESKQS